MKQTRKPKAKVVINRRTGQRLDPKTGRFQSKPGGPRSAKAISVEPGADVMTLLGERADPAKLARTLERLALQGHAGAIEWVVKALELKNQQRQDAGLSVEGIRRLGRPAQDLLVELLGIAGGEAAPSVEERLRTVSTYIFALKGFEGVAVAAALERALKELTSPSPPPVEKQQPQVAEPEPPPAQQQQQKRVAKEPEAKVVGIDEHMPDMRSPNAMLWRRSEWKTDYPV